MRTYRFTVEGQMAFPIDMLRYDSCWPADNDSVAAVTSSMDVDVRRQRRRSNEPFIVTLSSNHPPTPERWSSFAWRIVK